MFYYLRISRRVVLTKSELSGYFPWQKKNFKMDRRWISRKCGEPVLEKKSERQTGLSRVSQASRVFRSLSFLRRDSLRWPRNSRWYYGDIYIYIRYIYIRGIFLRKDIVHCSENMSRVSLCSSLQFAFRTPVSTTMRKLHDALLVSNFLHPYYH